MINLIDKKEYVDGLVKIIGIRNFPESPSLVIKRELNITVASDNYGRPSSAIIAFNGSPPRVPIYVRQRGGYPIQIGDKLYSTGKSRRSHNTLNELEKFLHDFLLSQGIELGYRC